MNAGLILDLIIILLAVSSIVRGWEIGSLRQLLSTLGFFVGLFIGAALQPKLINLTHTTTSRTVLTLSLTLGLAFLFLLIGETLGIHLKTKIHFKKINQLDNFLGSIISVITVFLMIWLTAAIISPMLIPGVEPAITQSRVIQTLNKELPDAPNIVSDLGKLIDPNGFPQVFIGDEPTPSTNINLPSLGSLAGAVASTKNSVVKIQGLGCGGLVEGSGFVISQNYIATNAHVVAGIKHPYVIDSNGTHGAKVVYFDPNLDFAVLQVNNLAGNALIINPSIVTNGTPGVVLGYPGGGQLTASAAAVINEFNAVGRNIYGLGTTTRSVYALKANVIPGNSGGPLVEADGQVIGMIFAESTTYSKVGYALTANQLINAIKQAENNHHTVSTGSCAK